MASTVRIPAPAPIREPGPVVTVRPAFPTPAFPTFPNRLPLDKATLDAIARSTAGRSGAAPRQIAIVPEGKPIRVTYGRDRIGADVVDVQVVNGVLGVLCVWGDAKGGQYDAIEDVYLGKKRFTGTRRHYLGSNTEPVDPFFAAAHASFQNPVSIAFSVLEFPTGFDLPSLDITAKLRGRRMTLAHGAGFGWSDKPGEALYDFLTKFLDANVPLADLDTVADWNDELLAVLTGDPRQDLGKYRHRFGITFDKIVDKDKVVATLQEYAQVFLAWEGDTLRMLPNKDGVSVATIGPSQIIADSASKWIESSRRRPNVVKLIYTDTSNDQEGWQDATFTTPIPPSGAIRESLIRMPAIQNLAMATRYATQRLNFLTVTELHGRFRTRDEGLQRLVGDLVDFTDTEGAVAKQIRVLNCPARGKGEWEVEWIENDPAAYVDTYIAEPTAPDSGLPNPNDIPEGVPTPTAVEVLWTDETGQTHTVFEIKWIGHADFPWVQAYRVQVKAGAVTMMDITVQSQGPGIEHLVVTPPTAQGLTYTVKVWTINVFGVSNVTPGSTTVVGNGKVIPPTSPSGLTGREANQFVALSWTASVDTDLRGYTIRRLEKTLFDAAGTSDERWNHVQAATLVKRIDSTLAVFEGQPIGEHYYMVKAEDFAGNFSVAFSAKLINVTEDQSGASVSAQVSYNATDSSNMYLFDTRVNEGLNGGEFLTVAVDAWEDIFTGGILSLWDDKYTASDPWTKFNPDGSVVSDWWDTGKDNTGNWSAAAAEIIVKVGPLWAWSQLVEAANFPPGTFDSFVGPSGNGTGRYIRTTWARSFPGGPEPPATTGFDFTLKLPIDFTFQGVRIFDSGSESVPAVGQPIAVLFNKQFNIPPRVTTQLSSATPGIANPDNVTTTGFDLHVWDLNGAAMAGTVTWTADGV